MPAQSPDKASGDARIIPITATVPRVVQNNFDWGLERSEPFPMEDLVIYELHVRGFTKSPSSGVSCPGTFKGLEEKISLSEKAGDQCGGA